MILSLLLSAAFAQDDGVPAPPPPVSVLVSSLQPRNADAKKLARLIEDFLAQELKDQDGVRVVRVEDTPSFQEYGARVYMDSCPPGEFVGCSLVVAERGEADWAVTGTVQALSGVTRVQVDIIDVANARVAVSFTSELGSGSDEAFAEGVARVLRAAIVGEIGREVDIREHPDEAAAARSPEENERVAAELRELDRDLGDVSATFSRTNAEIQQPTYTFDDLAESMETEGTKPWERLEMTPGEYLAFRNSGRTLEAWRERRMGRAGQLILELGGGFFRGPVASVYYARAQEDSVTLATTDVYAAQSATTGSGGSVGGRIGYGILPVLDVAVGAGIAFGTYTSLIGDPEKAEEIAQVTEIADTDQWIYGDLRATLAPFPEWIARPSLGVGALWMHGSGIAQHLDLTGSPYEVLDPEHDVFVAPNLFFVEVVPGAELRLSRYIDLWLTVPFDVLVGGNDFVELRGGTGSGLEDLATPARAEPLAVGVQGGLRVRLFGRKPAESSPIEEIDE